MASDNIVAVARALHLLCRAEITEATFAEYPLISPKAKGTMRGQNIPAGFNNLKIVSNNYDSLRSQTLSSHAICMGQGPYLLLSSSRVIWSSCWYLCLSRVRAGCSSNVKPTQHRFQAIWLACLKSWRERSMNRLFNLKLRGRSALTSQSLFFYCRNDPLNITQIGNELA